METLGDYLVPEWEASEHPLVFQQDNARIHKTAAVLAFLEEKGIQTLEWPPQSPDLSPIENVWNVIVMKMKAMRPRPNSHARMRDTMLDIWEELTDELRVGLLAGFRERLVKCLATNGDIVKNCGGANLRK